MPKYPAFEVPAPPEPAHPAATAALTRIVVLLADAHRAGRDTVRIAEVLDAISDQAATSNWRGQL